MNGYDIINRLNFNKIFMQKTIISFVVLIAVILGVYFIVNKDKKPETTPVLNTEVNNTEETPEVNGKKMAFSEFIKQGGSYKCDVKQSLSDFENSGTIYINGAKISGEYSTIAEGMNITSSFVMMDGYTYSWSSALPSMGVKVKMAKPDTSAEAKESATYTWNAEQIGEYNCEAWVVDEAKFKIPTNITFKEVGV